MLNNILISGKDIGGADEGQGGATPRQAKCENWATFGLHFDI